VIRKLALAALLAAGTLGGLTATASAQPPAPFERGDRDHYRAPTTTGACSGSSSATAATGTSAAPTGTGTTRTGPPAGWSGGGSTPGSTGSAGGNWSVPRVVFPVAPAS
jgi:hypothetical protein